MNELVEWRQAPMVRRKSGGPRGIVPIRGRGVRLTVRLRRHGCASRVVPRNLGDNAFWGLTFDRGGGRRGGG